MVKNTGVKNEDFKDQLERVIEQLMEEQQLLNELYKNNIQVKEIARQFGVTPNTLRRWCIEHFNMSARDYLLYFRVNKAKKLLLTGEKPSIIAQKLAFTEHKTFSTAFRRACNLSPREYYRLESSRNNC